MNKLGWLIGMFFTYGVCEAQNLVPNGDFEQHIGCPNNLAQIDSCLFWFNPTTNITTVSGTSDYYNACASNWVPDVPDNFMGYQSAHSDSAYSGILLFENMGANYREYIEVPLISTLSNNTCYYFEMYISLGELSKYTTDDVGIFFSDTAVSGINNYNALPFIPQINNSALNMPDTSTWKLVSGSYTATGNENYLIIGNFKDDMNTDSILYNSQAFHKWCYIYIDDVTLTPCTGIEERPNKTITVYPNPVNNKLNIALSDNKLSEIILYDIASRKLLQQSFIKSTSINTGQLAKGIYLYEVRNKNGVIKKGKVVKG